MWPALVLSGFLTLAQQPAEQEPSEIAKPAESIAPEAAVTPPVPAAAPERWFLMRALQGAWPGALLDDNRLRIYGWTEGSFTGSTDAETNLPIGFNYLANQFALQQNWLRVERSVVTTGTTEPTFGFRWDTILPGADYRYTVARGLFSQQLTADNGQPNKYGIDPVQFYAEGYFPTIGRGLDVKFGRFFAQFGAENIAAVDNLLVSHSYAFIYDPFTHTGLLTTLNLTDAWSVQNGMTLGADVFIDPADVPCYIGSVKWAPPNGRSSALFSVILCAAGFNQARQFNNPQVFDLVFTHKINSRLTYTLDALFGFQTNVPDIGTATWFTTVHYLSWLFTQKLTGTTRLEFFEDVNGQRTGFPGLYITPTAGLLYRPVPWLYLRPELRFDSNTRSSPFEGKPYLFTATMDVIVRW
jgi:hypothetical protein